jgi:hypothetical protein
MHVNVVNPNRVYPNRPGVFSEDFQLVQATINYMQQDVHNDTVRIPVCGFDRYSMVNVCTGAVAGHQLQAPVAIERLHLKVCQLTLEFVVTGDGAIQQPT